MDEEMDSSRRDRNLASLRNSRIERQREAELMNRAGVSRKDIAKKLGISIGTIYVYLKMNHSVLEDGDQQVGS